MQDIQFRLRIALKDRRVVFTSGLVVGCLLTGLVAPILDRVHISFDGPETVVYGDYVAEDEAMLAREDLGRLSEEELTALDVVEVSDPQIDGFSASLKEPAKRAKKRAAKPAVASATVAPVSSIVLTAKERELDPARRAYIASFSSVARKAATSNAPASFLLAAALVNGGSEYALKANNHFDKRCMSKTCPEGHCLRSDQYNQHKWFFTRYKSAADSYVAYAKSFKSSAPVSPAIDRVILIYSLKNLDK